MGKFSGLKDAKRGFASTVLQGGKYLCRIDKCDYFDTDSNGSMWKNTLTILAIEDGGEGQHKVGEVVNTFFREKAGKKLFQSNLKSFIAGVLDAKDDDIGEDVADACLEDNSPMKGLVTLVTARKRTSKDKKDDKTGEPISYIVYSWAPCLSAEETRAAIGDEAYAKFFPSEAAG